MANQSGDGKNPPYAEDSPEEGNNAEDSPGDEGQLCNVAVKDIFLSCDKNNCGLAQAQDLIAFISPYLYNNETELTCLRKCLDPQNSNPSITEKQFSNIMRIWISKIRATCSPENLRSLDSTPFNQFCFENSMSNQLSKSNNTAEIGVLNTSSTSTTSVGNVLQEFASLQETTNELEYQNRKLLEELSLVKSQLAASEEHNETLQSDLKELSSKLLVEQRLNEQIQAERRENEELRECSQGMTKKLELLQRSLSNLEKENGNMKQKLDVVEQENQKLENKLEQARRNELKKERSIVELRTEFDFKEAVIASLEKAVLDMEEKLKENQQVIENHIEINENLKVEKMMMEKLLKGQLSHSYSILPTSSKPITSISSGTFPIITNISNQHSNILPRGSPLTQLIKDKMNTFNSPKLVRMLKNPVSPILSKTAGQLNTSFDLSVVSELKSNASQDNENESVPKNTSFLVEPQLRDVTFFRKYRFVGGPNSFSLNQQNETKLRQPKSKDTDARIDTNSSPLKNNSTSSLLLHDISSEDDLFSKVPLTESAAVPQHSLLYELTQVNKENEINNNSNFILDQIKKENNDLKKHLDDCLQEIERLKTHIAAANDKLTYISNENRDLREELKRLVREKVYLQNENEINRENIEQLKRNMELGECASENLEHEHLQLLNSFDDLKREYAELKKNTSNESYVEISIKNKEDFIKKLETDFEMLKVKFTQSYEVSEEQRNDLLAQIKTLKKSIEFKDEAISEFNNRIKLLYLEIEKVALEKDATETAQLKKISECNEIIEEKNKIITELEKNAQLNESNIAKELEKERNISKKMQTEIENCHKSLKENSIFRREISKLEDLLNEKNETIMSLENAVSQMNSNLCQKEILINKLRDSDQENFVLLRKAMEEKVSLENKIQALNQIVQEKEVSLNSLNEEMVRLKSQLVSTKDSNEKKIAKLRNVIEEKNRSFSDLADQHEHLIENILEEEEKEKQLEKEIRALTETLKSKEEDINSIQALADDFKAKLTAANESFDESKASYKNEIDKLNSLLNEKEENIQDLEEVVINLQSQVMEFDSIRETDGKRNQYLENEFELLKIELKANEASIRKFNLDIVILQSELEKKETIIQNFEDNDQTLISQLEFMKKTLHQKEDCLKQLNDLNKKLMEKISAEESLTGHLRKENEETKVRLAEKKEDINNLYSSIEKLTVEIEQLHLKLNANRNIYEAQINSLQEQLRVKDCLIEKLKIEIISKMNVANSLSDESNRLNSFLKLQKTTLDNYQVQVNEMTNSLEGKSSKLDMFSNEIGQLKESLEEKDMTLTCLQKDFKELENRYEQKMSAIEELTTLLLSKQHKIDKLREKVHQLNASLKENRQIIDKLEAELSKIQNEVLDVKVPKPTKCTFDRLNAKIDKLREKNDSLEQQLEFEKNNSEKMIKENSELRNEMSLFKKTITELKEKLERCQGICNGNPDELFNTTKESPDSPGDVTEITVGVKNQESFAHGVTTSVASFAYNWENEPTSELELNLKGTLPILKTYRKKRSLIEKTEIREKFETFVLAITVDASTVNDRVNKQKNRLFTLEDSLANEFGKLLDLLDGVKDQNHDHPFVVNLILQCIEQVNVITDLSSNVVTVAVQTGSLQQEEVFMRSLCTLINYVSDVQRDLDIATSQLLVLNESEKTQPQKLVGEIKDVLLLEKKSENSNHEIEDENTLNLNIRRPSFSRRLFTRFTNCYRYFYTGCATFLFVSVLTVIIFFCVMDGDVCSPFIKMSYKLGPRPT